MKFNISARTQQLVTNPDLVSTVSGLYVNKQGLTKPSLSMIWVKDVDSKLISIWV